MEGHVSQISPTEWGDRYAAQLSQHELCALKMRDLMAELLAYADISTDVVEGRAKEVDSFIRKVESKGQKYQDPTVDMPDLVGLRVVTFITDDVSKVRSVIEDNFDIDWDRSSVGLDGDPDRFGYVSDHLEVRLKADRAALPEWEVFRDAWIEIQVRTVLQHAWAAISHKLQYKAEREVPSNLRRQLSRISALLEVADKEFSDLSAEGDALDQSYMSAVEAGDLNIELNGDSLAAYLQVTKRHLVYRDVAEEIGYAPFPVPDDEAADIAESNFSTLVMLALKGADVTEHWGLDDFDQLVPDPIPAELRHGLAVILNLSLDAGFVPTAVPVDMLILAYSLALKGLLDPHEAASTVEFVDELKQALETALSPSNEPSGD